MPMCPQCNASVPANSSRCFQCGASLTQRIANKASLGSPSISVNRKASPNSTTRIWKYVVALVIIMLVTVGLWSFSSPQKIEIEKGISILLPNGWKEVQTNKMGMMNAYAYRGELSEKVMLTMMIQLQIPQEARNKARQVEGLNAMLDILVQKDDPLPKITDISRGDVIHIQAIADDRRILNIASEQLATDDFKHLRLGTIIRNGDYIHYAIAFDEQSDVYHLVMQSVGDLARMHF